MAFRIGDYIHSGELRNSTRNSITGWISFGDDKGLRLELTGNFAGEFLGKDIAFLSVEPQPISDEFAEELNAMETMQAGTIGDVVWHIRKVPSCSMEELSRRLRAGEPFETVERAVLYLEWFSQNGRVVAELIDPEISWIQEDDTQIPIDLAPHPLPDESEFESDGPQITAFTQNEHGFVEEFPLTNPDEDSRKDDDPYELFPPGFNQQFAVSQVDKNEDVLAGSKETDAADLTTNGQDWADVIPDIDPETKRLYEQWDEILHGENHESVANLFDPPLTLPPPESLTEDEAAGQLEIILARLAEFCISIDMCKHATSLGTYHWLVNEILPQASFTPASLGSGFIQTYSTNEDCPECEAEFEARWAAEKHKGKDQKDHNEDIPW